jgi:hypothetical protein
MPFPYNLIAIAAMVAAGFLGGWQAQGWHRDSLEKDRAEQELVDQRLSAATAIRRTDNVIQAQNAATVREVRLRAAAADARTELERVRSLADEAVEAARNSHNACVERASALNDVFKGCSREVERVAEKADRHVNDVQTLMEAWPK